MPIANYTTSVTVTKSVDAVIKLLTAAKVRAIQTTYSESGEPDGLIFNVMTEWGPRDFSLPLNIEGVHAVLKKQRIEPRFKTLDHARRVAWRIAHDWLRVQLAMVEIGVSTMTEVMFPYLVLGYSEGEPVRTYTQYAKSQKELES